MHALTKQTVYSLFCAGETLKEALDTIQKNNLKSVLFFSIESSHKSAEFFDKVDELSLQLVNQ